MIREKMINKKVRRKNIFLGAVTTGLVYKLLSDPACAHLAEKLKLNSDSKIFLISTKGDTDPEMYRAIVK